MMTYHHILSYIGVYIAYYTPSYIQRDLKVSIHCYKGHIRDQYVAYA